MKRHLVFVCTLFISGCQLNLDTFSEPETNSPADNDKNNISTVSKNSRTPEQTRALAKSQTNVWDRISLQMEMPVEENERLKYYRSWYLNNPQHLITVSERAKPFLYLITEKIEEAGLPIEIALLPIVESSFDQYAYSHGSAAGLWQFVPVTGRYFGLKQDWWYDGRRDVMASTDAAIDLLKYLHDKFDGNWLHALAAYNTGEGRVFRAIRLNKGKGLPTDFWSLSLPKETRGYVPKLLAVADVIKNQQKYKFNLPPIANRPVVEQINPKVQMDLSVAANYAKLPLKTLKNLNPGYNHWATSPDGPFNLLLPKGNVETFIKNFQQHDEQGINTTRYKVIYGDTLSGIAQRFNTSVDVIQRANDLRKLTIRQGQHLLVPVSSQDKNKYANQPLTKSIQKPVKIAQNKPKNHKIIHNVINGQSVSVIADEYDVSEKSLLRWNKMSAKDTLRIGQSLVIWKKMEEGANIRTIAYQIKEGDVLGLIAQRYDIPLSDLIFWNALKENSNIKPGQKLTLHIDANKIKDETSIRQVVYQIQEGDALSLIADKFNVSTSDLIDWNDLKKNGYIKAGQKLTLHIDPKKDNVTTQKTNENSRIHTIVYQIQKGDALSLIAARYNVSLSDLILWNALSKNANIKPGQKLTLHVDINKVNV